MIIDKKYLEIINVSKEAISWFEKNLKRIKKEAILNCDSDFSYFKEIKKKILLSVVENDKIMSFDGNSFSYEKNLIRYESERYSYKKYLLDSGEVYKFQQFVNNKLKNSWEKTFNKEGRIISFKNSAGVHERFIYENGKLVKKLEEFKNKKNKYVKGETLYDENGNEVSYVNSNEFSWEKTYDENGNEISYIDSKGDFWKKTYDERGNQTSLSGSNVLKNWVREYILTDEYFEQKLNNKTELKIFF